MNKYFFRFLVVFFFFMIVCVKYFIFKEKFIFKHGAKYKLPDGKILIPSYHPSPRNVNTKIIDVKKMTILLNEAKKAL